MGESAQVNPSSEEPRGQGTRPPRWAGAKARGAWRVLQVPQSGKSPFLLLRGKSEGAEVAEEPSSSSREQNGQ